MDSKIILSVLENSFRISISESAEVSSQIRATDLLDKNKAKAFLHKVGNDLHSPSLIVTTSVLFKRLLALFAGALYCMSHRSYGINLDLANITLVGEPDWKMPSFYLEQLEGAGQLQGLGDPQENREHWRTKVVKQMFAETLQPLIASLAASSRINTKTLWAHAAYIMHYYYELWQKEAETDQLRDLIALDFRFLVEIADPSLYGLSDKNPMNITFRTALHPAEEGDLIRIRKKCCLANRLPGAKCCYTCPMLDEEQRGKQLLAMGH